MQFGISEDITPRWSRKNLVVRKQELGVGRGQKSEHDVCLLVFLQRTVGQGGDLKACLWGCLLYTSDAADDPRVV